MEVVVALPQPRVDPGSLIVHAAALILVVCTSLAWSTEPQETKTISTNSAPQPEQRGTDKSPLIISGVVTAQKDKAEAAADAKEREFKSHLDSSLVKYTFWLAIGTVLLFVAAAVQVMLFFWQLRLIGRSEQQAKQVAEAAKTSADASLLALRPWLACKVEIAGPLTFNPAGDAIFPLKFVLRNVGKTPAMSVSLFFPQLTLHSPLHEHSILKLQRLAADSRGLPSKGGTILIPGQVPIANPSGRLLFPDEEFVETWTMPISNAELLKACEGIRPATHFWPELVVLVTYVYQLANVRADTGFVYEISRRGRVPFQIGEGVPIDELRIEPHNMWGGFAS